MWDDLAGTWDAVRSRFAAYELVLPGSPSFSCLVGDCPRHCCARFSVPLGDREVARMEHESGRRAVEFLESEDGEPIVLPLAQPYLLKRSGGNCALILPDLRCGEYAGRPDACRLYPHFVLAASRSGGRVAGASAEAIRAAQAQLRAGAAGPIVPLLVRHLDCPGFDGPPHSEASWWDLLETTIALQYPAGTP